MTFDLSSNGAIPVAGCVANASYQIFSVNAAQPLTIPNLTHDNAAAAAPLFTGWIKVFHP